MVNHNKFKKQLLKNAQLALPNNANLSAKEKKRLGKVILSPKSKFKYFKSLDPVMAKAKLMAEFKNKCSYNLWNSFVNNHLNFARSDLNFSEAFTLAYLKLKRLYCSK